MTREEIINELKTGTCYECTYGCMNTVNCENEKCPFRKAVLMAIKALEQEQETGRWERHYSRPNVYADLFWHCSKCGYKNSDNYANIYHHYCPNCGAKMEKEESEGINETN